MYAPKFCLYRRSQAEGSYPLSVVCRFLSQDRYKHRVKAGISHQEAMKDMLRIFAHISPESPKSGSRSRAFTALLLTVAVLFGLSFSGIANAKTPNNNKTAYIVAPTHAGQKHKPNYWSTGSNHFANFQSTLPFDTTNPTAIGIDYSGNLYTGDFSTGNIYMEAPVATGGYTETLLFTTVAYGPVNIAVDYAGNVFVTTFFNSEVFEGINNGDGTYTVVTIGSGFDTPYGLAVDFYGDVYIADFEGGTVYEEVPTGTAGVYTQTAIITNIDYPAAVAVDGYLNLYVADVYDGLVFQETYQGFFGSYSATSIGSGWVGPAEIAVDNAGNVYVGDQGVNTISVLYPNGSGGYSQALVTDWVSEGIGMAVDSLNNLYFANEGYVTFNEISNTFGGVQVGFANTSNYQVVVNFDLNGTFTVGTAQVTTQGATGFDFSDVITADTCSGMVVDGATTCSVTVQFAPSVPGARTGAVTLVDNSETPVPIANSPSFSGTGIAPRASFWPGTWSYVTGEYTGEKQAPSFAKQREKQHLKVPKLPPQGAAKSLQIGAIDTYPGYAPNGIVIDPNGNYFVEDDYYGQIYAYFPATATWIDLPVDPYLFPSGGLAIDGGGNVIYSVWNSYDNDASVVTDLNLGNYTYDPTPFVIAEYTNTGSGQLVYVNNVAVDADSNIYFTGSDDNYLDAYAFSLPALSLGLNLPTRLPNQFDYLTGISVSNSGVIALSDYMLGQVYIEFPESNGYYYSEQVIRGLDTPVAVNWTPYGNLYIVDSGDDTGVSAIYYGYPNGACCGASYGFNVDPIALANWWDYGDAYFANFTSDQNGNFYLTDDGFYGGLITQIDVNDPPSYTFDTTDVGLVSDDSPWTVYLADTGNDTLVLPAPASGFNPSISPSFLLDSTYYSFFPGGLVPATDCPLISSGGTATNIYPNYPCALPVSFAPLAAGSISGTLVVTDNSLYGSSAVPLTKGAKPQVKGVSHISMTRDGKLAKNAHPMDSGATAQTINLNGTGVDYFSVTFTVTGGAVPPVVKAGGSLDVSFVVAPSAPATYFPLPVVMSAAGGPQGTSYTFNPSVVPAGSGSTTVVLTINIPIDYVAKNDAPAAPGQNNGTKLPIAPLALALLLLPMAGKLRKAGKRMSRMVAMMLLAIAGITATATLIGCGANKAAVYEIVVTGTAGALSNSASFDITVAGR